MHKLQEIFLYPKIRHNQIQRMLNNYFLYKYQQNSTFIKINIVCCNLFFHILHIVIQFRLPLIKYVKSWHSGDNTALKNVRKCTDIRAVVNREIVLCVCVFVSVQGLRTPKKSAANKVFLDMRIKSLASINYHYLLITVNSDQFT